MIKIIKITLNSKIMEYTGQIIKKIVYEPQLI